MIARMRKLVPFTEKKKKDKDQEDVEGEAAKKLSFEERIVVTRPMYEKGSCPKVIFLSLLIFFLPLKNYVV